MKIIWSNQSKNSYEKTIDFILDQWNAQIATDFENRVNMLLNRLVLDSQLCPIFKISNLRKCIIHKNISLIYLVKETDVFLITFIDNRAKHSY